MRQAILSALRLPEAYATTGQRVSQAAPARPKPPGIERGCGGVSVLSGGPPIVGVRCGLPMGVFSSVGRATALQAVGRRFEPCNTHH